jgi:hypothetical protein
VGSIPTPQLFFNILKLIIMNQEEFNELLTTSEDVVTIKGKIFAAGFDFTTDKKLVFENCTFGGYCTFGRYCMFGHSCTFGNFCNFGGYSTFWEACNFGQSCTFGDFCKFWHSCTFGSKCTFGGDCQFCGFTLEQIKADFFKILGGLTSEISGLKTALIEGKVDGSAYEGACACLVGTIANIRRENYKEMLDIIPNAWRPAERFFTNIHKGNTPSNSAIGAIVLAWIEEFQASL